MKNRFATPIALFLCYWFLQVQVNTVCANPAGVPWGNQSDLPLAGTYSGIMVPVSESEDFVDDNGVVDVDGFVNANSLGLFSIGLEEAGFSVGSVVMFFEGGTFLGDIGVIGNAASQQLIGVIDADATLIQLDYIQTGIDPDTGLPVFEEISSLPQASGNVIANVVSTGNADLFSTTASSLVGSAKVAITGDIHGTLPDSVTFEVQGLKQSDEIINSDFDVF